jgi:hypothetical protein
MIVRQGNQMTFRKLLLSALLIGSATLAQAAGPNLQQVATAEQQKACRPDVRRYCHKIPQNAGDNAFLACLQDHRAQLSPACRNVLESNGV